MKNYHLTPINHENIDCIYIKFNGGEDMYIPVDDLLVVIQQFHAIPNRPILKRAVVNDSTFRNGPKGDLHNEYPHD
jgi:hypothetical protein